MTGNPKESEGSHYTGSSLPSTARGRERWFSIKHAVIGAAVGAAIGIGVYWLAYYIADIDISKVSVVEARKMADLRNVTILMLAGLGAVLQGVRPLREHTYRQFRRNEKLIRETFRTLHTPTL